MNPAPRRRAPSAPPRLGPLLALLILVLPGRAAAQVQADLRALTGAGGPYMEYVDAPNSLYRYLESVVKRDAAARDSAVARLSTRADWLARQAEVRRKLQEALGPFPPRTPLHARVTGTLKRDGYRVDRVLFESRPGYYVTGALFLPARRRGRAPAVLYLSGHAALGFRGALYQHVILNLVRKGFVVFAIDPIGQGERQEYLDPATGESVFGREPTSEHAYPGAQLFLTGASLARTMIWDGIRALDYLVTRPEVDPARIGATGRSGGGTQTAYLAAFDDRVLAAAPENYVTSFVRLWETHGPQDAEQHFPGGIARGLDVADLLVARAPKPTLLVTTTRDMFNIQGARETYAEAERAFAALGAPEGLRMVEDDTVHASTVRNRERTYAFFQRALDLPGDSTDVEVETIPPEALNATPTGRVLALPGARSTFELNARRADSLRAVRAAVRDPAATLAAARRLSGWRDPGAPGSAAFMGRFDRDGYVVEKYILSGEGGYPIPLLLLKPADRRPHPAVLYLDPEGKAARAAPGGELEWLVRQGYAVAAPDLLGYGEMGPGDFMGDSYHFGDRGSTRYGFWFGALSVDRSIVGIQAADLVRVTRWLGTRRDVSGTAAGIARGELGPVLLHAAAFEPAIAGAALVGGLDSYDDLVHTRDYRTRFIPAAVPQMLAAYDLPALEAALAPRPVLLLNPVNAAGAPLPDAPRMSEAQVRDALRAWLARTARP